MERNGIFNQTNTNKLVLWLSRFIEDYHYKIIEEDKVETFKQTLVKAFPHLYDKIYKQTSFDQDGFEQIIPDEDEMMQIDELMQFIAKKKTISADELIYEE